MALAAKALGVRVQENTVQMLKDARGRLQHVALVNVLDGLGNDGRGNTCDGKVSEGGVDVSFEGTLRSHGTLQAGVGQSIC